MTPEETLRSPIFDTGYSFAVAKAATVGFIVPATSSHKLHCMSRRSDTRDVHDVEHMTSSSTKLRHVDFRQDVVAT